MWMEHDNIREVEKGLFELVDKYNPEEHELFVMSLEKYAIKLLELLSSHFMKENKDRSIFRKNIGRAILSKKDDSFLEQWNWDLTTRANKDKYSSLVDFEKQKSIEEEVSQYIKNNFSFAIFEVKSKTDRLNFESKLISTISLCEDCKSSSQWLGQSSPIHKIKESGLWLVQGLYKTPLDLDELEKIKSLSD